eukprot:1357786-Amorphochlora_amoeboformis.AAC.1
MSKTTDANSNPMFIIVQGKPPLACDESDDIDVGIVILRIVVGLVVVIVYDYWLKSLLSA